MRIDSSHPDFGTTLVFLDGKVCRGAIAADDEEGYIEYPDLSGLASPSLDKIDVFASGSEDSVLEWEQIPVKRKLGKVSFKKLS